MVAGKPSGFLSPEVGGREGWENLAFIQAAYASLEKRAPQEVPIFTGVEAGRQA